MSDCDSLEHQSPLGSHFTFEGGGDRKITKDSKWSWRGMITSTQRLYTWINSCKVKATTNSLFKRNFEVHLSPNSKWARLIFLEKADLVKCR